jgi:catechol 2,3-dioxygenase
MAQAPAKLPPATRIGHTHLKVADLDRSVQFYCEVLGFDLIERVGDQVAFVSAGGYHHHIGLNTWMSRHGTPPEPGHTGLYHHAIVVPTRRDLADVVKRVVDSGWPLTGAADHLTHEAVYLEDPDGIGIELYWDRPQDQWPRKPNGQVTLIGGHALDLQDLLAQAGR